MSAKQDGSLLNEINPVWKRVYKTRRHLFCVKLILHNNYFAELFVFNHRVPSIGNMLRWQQNMRLYNEFAK